jgi:hypothetical protein
MAGPNLNIVTATASTFRAEDAADGRFFIFGTVGSGLLKFEVVARLPDGTRGSVRGRESFDAMMRHFGAQVRLIEGNWSRQSGLITNLDLFNQATAAGLPPEQAALVATRTGQWADDYGYSTVSIIDLDPPNATGNYDKVVVYFSR